MSLKLFQSNLVIDARSDRCDDFRLVVVHVAGVRVLDVEAGAGGVTDARQRTVL